MKVGDLVGLKSESYKRYGSIGVIMKIAEPWVWITWATDLACEPAYIENVVKKTGR